MFSTGGGGDFISSFVDVTFFILAALSEKMLLLLCP